MNSDGIQGFLAESQSTTPRASSPHYAEDNPSVLPKDGGKGEQRISQQVIRVILVTHGDTIADDWHAVEVCL